MIVSGLFSNRNSTFFVSLLPQFLVAKYKISVRRSHNEGWKHKANVKAYFTQYIDDHVQKIIDQRVKEYEARISKPLTAPPFVPGRGK